MPLVISPQQLAVDSSVFVESLARVNTIGIEATIERPKAYKNAKMQYRKADFWPSYGSTATGASVAPNFGTREYTTPRFQLKVNFMFDNHSLVMNSKREVILKKNTLQAKGPTGLVRDDRGLPHQKGLVAVGSAPSGGAIASSSHSATGVGGSSYRAQY